MSDKIPSITFYGGAETVTGSKTLLKYKSTQVLIDCGLFQGLKKFQLLVELFSRFMTIFKRFLISILKEIYPSQILF